jgi:hypothetical protein
MSKKVRKPKVPKTGHKVRYAGAHGGGVTVWLKDNPRKGVCEACGHSKERGEIAFTALHHWWYEFQPATVKENPILSTKNTSELCFYCHQLGDAIRCLLYARPERVGQVAELLRGEPRAKFIRVLREVISRLETQDVDLAKKLIEIGRNGKSPS